VSGRKAAEACCASRLGWLDSVPFLQHDDFGGLNSVPFLQHDDYGGLDSVLFLQHGDFFSSVSLCIVLTRWNAYWLLYILECIRICVVFLICEIHCMYFERSIVNVLIN